MKLRKTILFLTTSNLATNPRLVKEIKLAIKLNYHVSVICFSFNNWSEELNQQIKKEFGSSFQILEIPAGRKPIFPWFFSSLCQLFYKMLIPFINIRIVVLSISLNKRTWLLQNALKNFNGKPDLIVAHNPGSFFPAFAYSKKKKIPFGIDVEDYHPGETNHALQSDLMKKMMQAVLPDAAYITAASPLILERVKKDCNEKLNCTETVMNYFDSNEFLSPLNDKPEKLQFVWFSQYISEGRGLEKFIETVKLFPNEVELHLYGELNKSFYRNYLEFVSNVVVHPAIPQKELLQELSKYDVGLAVEDSSANVNRDICLTNKLLCYYQAGLFIFASHTSAQKQFIEQYPEHGIVSSIKSEDLINCIQKMIEQKNKIRQTSFQRYKKASNQESEKELKKLSILWKIIMSKTV